MSQLTDEQVKELSKELKGTNENNESIKKNN